jgi:hypothetical protein
LGEWDLTRTLAKEKKKRSRKKRKTRRKRKIKKKRNKSTIRTNSRDHNKNSRDTKNLQAISWFNIDSNNNSNKYLNKRRTLVVEGANNNHSA